MKYILLLIIAFVIIGCKSDSNEKNLDLADLNLIIKTDKKIDSVWISNIGQTESFFLPFKDTVKVDFNEKINDLYNIGFYTKNGRLTNQLWLNGSNAIINGKLDEKIEIDSVFNSDLYYSSINFSKEYRALIKTKADNASINDFLLKNIKKNIGNPFSLATADNYIDRNQNDKDKIRKLFTILENQNDTLKNHFFGIHERIENILEVSSIDFSNYKFANLENEITSIKLEKTITYLLDFWFVNCPPCIRDHKQIEKKLDFLKGKNIELIGISTDREYSNWKNYLNKHNYNWKNFREIDTLKQVTEEMVIWSFPTYLLMDGRGKIKARFNSFEDFEKYVNK